MVKAQLCGDERLPEIPAPQQLGARVHNPPSLLSMLWATVAAFCKNVMVANIPLDVSYL